ncbi:helix-turn-helix domain-containing protein [Chryseobacterium binzhouense]|uniref:helix-turn-helix domain-containing protein n=1 Tax=Chryseobacterium binzhouense TaxID=2593646 RepID=UPI00289862CF|nr:helix-turn-helix domain-containing protein [Chryseobacterium binzhouense]
MTFKTFQLFNQYLGVNAPVSEKIDFGKYENHLPLKVKSDAVNVDFYRISLKGNINFTDVHQKELQHKTVLFFNSPNQSFEWNLQEKWQGFYVQIAKNVIENHRFLFRNCMEYGMHEALVLEAEEAQEMQQIFNLLHLHYNNQNYDFDIVLSYTNIIISLVEKFYKRQFSVHQKEYNWIVKKFQELLYDYYNNSVSQTPNVAYFAEKLNLSSNYLGDVVKHFTGTNAKDFIQNHIAETAKKLLLETTSSNSEIAYQLGFEYPNYFAKFFKKHFGKSPKEFRSQEM